MLIRFLPGLIGAIAAYVAAKLTALLASLPAEIGAFVIAYAVVTYAVDASMRRYGKSES